MKYQRLAILLTGHGLEDFPLHHQGDDAEELLSGWTALWHPALIASAQSMPTWYQVDDPPDSFAGHLLVIPGVSHSEMPAGMTSRAQEEGANIIRRMPLLDDILQAAIKELDGEVHVDEDLTEDFLALGFTYLQVALLTHQMHYSTSLDEVHFGNQVVAAADAAVRGDALAAREQLSSCFDVLAEERDHYYPVDAYALDLTLLASSTLGDELREELAAATPKNLMVSAAVLGELAREDPDQIEVVKRRLQEGTLSFIGGDLAERRLPLFPLEGLLSQLRRGRVEHEKLVGAPPAIYGRRRYGLTPAMPQLLDGLGYQGVFHATLDDGRFPEGSQSKTRWEGLDGSPIDALAKAPLDATEIDTYLGFSSKLSESMGMDHVATLMFAHWPGRVSPWLRYIHRASKYTSVLGRFMTLDEYFEQTDNAGHADRFAADEYRSPYLKQAIIREKADPISTTLRYWRRRAAAEAAAALGMLLGQLTGEGPSGAGVLLDRVDDSADEAEADGTLDGEVDQLLSAARDRLAETICGAESGEGVLVFNPLSFARRINVATNTLAAPPAEEKPVFATGKHDATVQAVVEVPAMGFSWVGRGKDAEPKAAKLCGEGLTLQNEFFTATFNETTGTLQSIHDYKQRGNRFSQQLALRLEGQRPEPGTKYKDPDEEAVYSVMAADEVKLTKATTAMGEMTCRGRLLNKKGQKLAEFVQVYRLWRGSRLLELDVELDIDEEPRADPWNSYYCCRFAWADEAAYTYRTINSQRQSVAMRRFESPLYVDMDGAESRTTVLCGGLPYHRRVGGRMLDTLLIVRGERQRKFQLGIGLDLDYPYRHAVSFLSPALVQSTVAGPPKPAASSWLFHVDLRNVVATHWECLERDGSVVGFRARLLEVAGRSGKLSLSCLKNVAVARRTDYNREPLGDCEVAGDKITFDIDPHQLVQLEAEWAS